MVKFNVSVLNRLKITFFFLIIKHIHEHNVSFNKTLTKLVTILTKCFFPYLNPTSYLNGKFLSLKWADIYSLWQILRRICTPRKMKIFIKNLTRKCDQIRRKLWIRSYLLKKSLMDSIIFSAVHIFAIQES